MSLLHIIKLDGNTVGCFTGIKNVKVNEPKKFINKLRHRMPNTTIQVVNAKFVAGPHHIELILKQAYDAWRRGISYAEKYDVDLIVRLACNLQIEKALKKVGVKRGVMDVVLIAIGDRSIVKKLYKLAYNIGDPSDEPIKLTDDKVRFLKEEYRISDEVIHSTLKDVEKIPFLLAEKAALLLATSR